MYFGSLKEKSSNFRLKKEDLCHFYSCQTSKWVKFVCKNSRKLQKSLSGFLAFKIFYLRVLHGTKSNRKSSEEPNPTSIS